MLTLTDIINRTRTVLSDPVSLRFSDELLQEAVSNAMQTLSDRLPREEHIDFIVAISGRNQALAGLALPLYLIDIRISILPDDETVLEPDLHFTYRMIDGQPVIHFLGELIPQAGQTLQVAYAACQTLSGLDGADTSTLPDGAFTALVNGAAGHACLLRSHMLLETSGVKPGEVDHLLQLAQLRLDLFEKNLDDLRIYQEFGFPQGFTLDKWDNHGVF